MDKFFLHRIQKENGVFSKGIEVHDTMDSAMLSCHGRMKNAYGANPDVTFMSCKITANSAAPIYEEVYRANSENGENQFFMHNIRLDGDTFTKGIDTGTTFNSAKAALHAAMEYGYGNTRFPNVTFVSCMITDMAGNVYLPETWEHSEPEPEPEPPVVEPEEA